MQNEVGGSARLLWLGGGGLGGLGGGWKGVGGGGGGWGGWGGGLGGGGEGWGGGVGGGGGGLSDEELHALKVLTVRILWLWSNERVTLKLP